MNNLENLQQQLEDAIKKSEHKKIVNICNKLIELNPKDEENFFTRGNAKYNLIDYKGAIKDFSQAIKLNSKYIEAYLYRGNANNYLEYLEKAIKDYTQVLILNTKYIDVYYFRGFLKYRLGDFKGAIEDYSQVIKLEQKYVDAYIGRGLSKCELGDYNGAIEDYSQAIELNSSDDEAFIHRGNVKREIKDFNGAIEDYTQAIALNPVNASVYNYRGLSKYRLGDFKGAIEDYNKVIELDPEISNVYYNRGSSKKFLGDYNGAIEDYKESFRLVLKNEKKPFNDDNKILYKYRAINENTQSMLINGELYFASPKNFNDPMDCPLLNIIKNDQSLEKALESIKVCSLAKNKKNLLMWGHYTDGYQGICIGYDFSDYNVYMEKLDYQSEINIDYSALENTIKTGFFTKNIIWKYEKEFRLLWFDDSNSEKGVCQPAPPIKEIIFGLKCPKKEQETIMKILEHEQVTYYTMERDVKNHFAVIIKEQKE